MVVAAWLHSYETQFDFLTPSISTSNLPGGHSTLFPLTFPSCLCSSLATDMLSEHVFYALSYHV